MNIFKLQQLIKIKKDDIRTDPDKLPPLLKTSIDTYISDAKLDEKWGASIRSRVASYQLERPYERQSRSPYGSSKMTSTDVKIPKGS